MKRISRACLVLVLVLVTTATGSVAPAFAGTLTAPTFKVAGSATSTTGASNQRYDYAFNTASTATLRRVTETVPNGTDSTGSRYLALNGGANNYASTPDASANQLTGDIDVRVNAALDWQNSANALIAKWNNPGNKYSWIFALNTGGYLSMAWMDTGGTVHQLTSTTSVPFTTNQNGWARFTLKLNNAGLYNMQFYTSTDGTNWSTNYSMFTGSASTLNNASTPITVGSYDGGAATAVGKLYYSDVRSGISTAVLSPSTCSQAAVALCFNPNDATQSQAAAGAWKSASTGEAWTITRSGSNLPADVASDLTVVSVTGLSASGSAAYRMIDGLAVYTPTTPASVPAATAVAIQLSGFTNTLSAANLTSTISTYDNSGTPVLVDSATTSGVTFTDSAGTVVSVNGGYNDTCALTNTGNAYCWGANLYGEDGDGTATQRNLPVAVLGGLTFKSAPSIGFYHSCGISTSGITYCWGKDSNGQLGDGLTTQRNVPAAISGGLQFKSVYAGGSQSCGLTSLGAAYCWGDNTHGQLGDGTTTQRLTPTAVTGGLTFASLTMGNGQVCGLTSVGVAYCWGYNGANELGDGTATDRSSPTAVSGGLTFANISGTGDATCGVTTGNAAYCWGINNWGNVGDGSTTNRLVPTAVSGGLAFKYVVGGYAAADHVCGVTTTNATYCWGSGGAGEVGNGVTSNVYVPTLVDGGHKFSMLSSGGSQNCGIEAGALFCWGWNPYGQIGDGSSSNQSRPVLVHLILTATNGTVVASATIDPSFTFTVSAHSGACRGNAQTGTATATAVNLGHINSSSAVTASQDLSVVTNAGGGGSLLIRYTGVMADGNGHTIADMPGDGTWTNAQTFPSTGTAAFGYTLGWVPSGWMPLVSTNQGAGTFSIGGYSTCAIYQAQTASTTPAGSYSATVVYTAVPTF